MWWAPTDTGADTLADARTGKNGRHLLGGLLRQSVFGRLAGYEDVTDRAISLPRASLRSRITPNSREAEECRIKS